MPAKIVMGLGFGDEGKGVTTYHLAKETNAKWVIRYNGGCQAAHNIINENGIHHTCSQIGAGFMCGSKTFHSKYTMINPLFLLNEIRVLKKHFNMKELFNTIYIDEDCPVITIYHVLANRVKADIHNAGTTGHGIGELAHDIQYYPDEVIRIKDILNSSIIEKLEVIRKRKLKEIESYMENNIHLHPRNPGPVLEDIISSSNYTKLLDEQTSKDLDEFYRDILSLVNCVSDSNNFISEEIIPFNIVFEGAQGLLLDENHGFKPYTTWSTTTSENAVKFLKDVDYKEEYEIIGVVRPYLTKHGAGPFLNTHQLPQW